MTWQKAASAREPGCPSARLVLAMEMEIAKLPRDEAAVLRMRYGLRGRMQTVVATAAARGLPLYAARRLQSRALQRLRRLSLERMNDKEWDEV